MKTKQTVGITLCLIIVLALISTAIFASGSDVTLDITDGNVYLRESAGTLQYSRDNAAWTDYTGTLTVVQEGEQTGISEYLQKQIVIISGEHTVAIDNISTKGQSDGCAAIDISVGATLHLILQNSSFISGSSVMKPGLSVPSGATLIIEEVSTGSLSTSGNDYCAGIGGGLNQSAGTVTIKGGTINAYGGKYGAGIGGGGNQIVEADIPTDGETIIVENEGGGNGGNVTIDGGTVNAVGGQYSAGIGGGGNQSDGISIGGSGIFGSGGTYYTSYGTHAGNGGTLTVNGGTVTATGGFKSPGIGGGSNERISLFGTANAGGECGTITINGGTVNATGDTSSSPGIGNGGNGSNSIENCGTLTVNGGKLTAEANNPINASTGGAAIGGGTVAGDDSTGVVGINVIINDGTVRAIAASRSVLEDITGLHSIGAGGMGENHGTLTINGGSLYADTTVCPTPKNNNGDTLYPHTASIGVSDVPLFMDISENTSGLPYAYASRHVYPDADGNAYIYLKSDDITNYTIKSGILRTVTFDADGGTPTHASIAAANGNTVTLPADYGEPVREGFRFENWYMDNSHTGSPFDFSNTVISNDITLYAKWTALYTVSFSAGAKGETTNASQTVADGTVIDISGSLARFTRDNYTCIGLATSDGQNTPVYTSTLTVRKNVTLYPVWKTNLRTVSIDPGSADYYVTLGVKYQRTGYICIRTAEEFKLLAEYIDGNPFGRNANVILLNDIDFNPGYSPTFIPDTGLVKMTKGTDTVYIGTGILGTSGTSVQFDSTASIGGVFYSFNGAEYDTTEAPSDLYIWTPIDGDGYAGIFDGNNKTISGLYCLDTSAIKVSIFKTVSPVGEIMNLTVGNSCFIGNSYVGSVCGTNDGTINNCHNSSIIVGYEYIGGVCGDNQKSLKYSSNTGIVHVISSPGGCVVGGMCGANSGEIVECYNNGATYGAIVGGICGKNLGAVDSCLNEGIINTGANTAGGICGSNGKSILSSRNSGTISAGNNTGGICGANYGAVYGCLNVGTVNASNENGGGICGSNYDGFNIYGTISYCLNTGNVSGLRNIGGVCGKNSSAGNLSGFRNCLSTGTVSGNYYVGGVCGAYESGAISNCYYLSGSATDGNNIPQYGIGNETTGNTTADDNEKTAGKTGTELANGSVTYALNAGIVYADSFLWCQDDSIPMLIRFHSITLNGDGYYEINTAIDLIRLMIEINNAGEETRINAKLMDNIDLNPGYTFTFEPDTGLVELVKDSTTVGYCGTGIRGDGSGPNTVFDDVASDSAIFYRSCTGTDTTAVPTDLLVWTPIGSMSKSYKGLFDGNGKTVSGVYLNDTQLKNIGLFAESIGKVEKLTVSNSYIYGRGNAGGICGFNNGDIENCHISDSVTVSAVGSSYGASVGGVCGTNTENIKNCHSFGSILYYNNRDGIMYAGGICGKNNNKINNCSNSGIITVNTINQSFPLYIGGICGQNDNTIDNCCNSGIITINSSLGNGTLYIGGVCGQSTDAIGCYNTGAIHVSAEDKCLYIGGVCGEFGGYSVEECYNTGEISVYTTNETSYTGGVCGKSAGFAISNCYNTGVIGVRNTNGISYTGGVCGQGFGSYVYECHNTGAVYVCGLPVNAYTGGVYGAFENDMTTVTDFTVTDFVVRCYNTGEINTEDSNELSYTGGVCGFIENGSRIVNCFNIGTVIEGGETINNSNGICNNEEATFYCYSISDLVSDNEGTTYTTKDKFSDGTVAWLLNHNDDDIINVFNKWSQGAEHPIFADETHKPTYKISINGAKTADYYTDAAGKCEALETLHGDGISAETVYTDDAEYTADAAITGVTPTVTDSIRFTYHVTAARDLIPTLGIIFGGKTVTLTSTPSGDGDYLDYDFTFEGILPQQMTENIAAKLMISGTQYATKSQYSVKAYVFSQLPTGDYTIEKFLVNMLYYGEAAQRHLGRTENLATEGLDALLGEDVIADYRTSDSDWNTLMPETVKAVTDTHEGEIITWKSATLVFDKTITMRLRFTAPASTVIPLDYKFNNTIPFSDAVNEKTEEGITTYYIDITGFTPSDYEDVITMTLYNNSITPEAVSEEVTYSVMSYIRSKKDSASMMVLVRALYDYGISGKAYKGV